MAAPIPSGSITKQRLGIGYDRTGTVARANMSCGERNQSTGDLPMVTLLAHHRSTAVYPNMLCNLLCIRKLALFGRLNFLIFVGETQTWYHSDLLTAISARPLLVPNLSRIAHVVMMMGFFFRPYPCAPL